MNKNILLFFIFILSVGAAHAGEEQTVARVDGSAITVADFSGYMDARPLPGVKETGEEVAGRLEEMITAEFLYREALRLGIDRQPEERQVIRQLLGQKLLDAQVNRPVWEREITEEELQEYYNDHIDEFVQPERVRLADIFIAVPEEAAPGVRDEKRKRAGEALNALRERKGRFVFGEVIAEYSDKPSHYAKGDTGFFDKEGSPAGLGKEMVEAAFGLSRNGEIYNKVIETMDGFHIIMLTGKRSAFKKELKDVSRQLEQRIRKGELARKRKEYIESLRGRTKIEIEEQSLEEIIAQMKKSPGKRPSGKTGKNLRPPALPGEKKIKN